MKEFKPDFSRLRKVLLREGEPDILPFYELFADNVIVTAVTGKSVNYETIVEFYYMLGYDYVPVTLDFSYKRYTNDTLDNSLLSKGRRHFVDDNHGIIENRKDFDRYIWPIVDKSIIKPVQEIIKYLPEGMKVIISTNGGVFENIMWIMGHLPFSYALNDDKQLIRDMFEIIGSNLVATQKVCLENIDLSKIGAIELGDDLGFYNGTVISPDNLRELVFPWHKKVVDIAHNFDLPVLMHSCGNLNEIMDDLIDDVGIDAKHSFEDKIMPVTEAKHKYGDRIALLGGIDMNVISSATEDEVRGYVQNVIDVCAPGGGYALGTGNSVANYVPVKNYLAMLDQGRKQ